MKDGVGSSRLDDGCEHSDDHSNGCRHVCFYCSSLCFVGERVCVRFAFLFLHVFDVFMFLICFSVCLHSRFRVNVCAHMIKPCILGMFGEHKTCPNKNSSPSKGAISLKSNENRTFF